MAERCPMPDARESVGDEHVRLEAEVERLRRENDSLRLDRDSSEYQRRKDNEYLLTELAALREAAQAVMDAPYSPHTPYVEFQEALADLRAALNPGAEG
jgi:hypothetical protein